MLNKNGFESLAAGEPLTETQPITETQPSFRGAFGDVYRFILQAVKGDRAVADMIFEDYLHGKLSEELLSISRACVSAEQAGALTTARSRRDGVENQQLRGRWR